MAKSKADKKFVVSQAYFELIERKAELLDRITQDVDLTEIGMEIQRVSKEWDKYKAEDLRGTEEPYVEPKKK